MKDPLKREIRRILRGYIGYDSAERLVASERTERLRLLGLFNGAGAAGVFGVAVRRRKYAVSDGLSDVMADCRDTFARMGRSVALDASPELTAVFYSPVFRNPSVLTAQYAGDTLVISVYTARSLTVRFNASRAFHRWRRYMPLGLREKLLEDTKRPRKKRRSGAPPENPPQSAGKAPEPDSGAEE